MPHWLLVLSWISLSLGFASALAIALDVFAGHRQHMWIMNVVWPITALYAGPVALWSYFKVGRLSTRHRMREDKAHGEKPFAQRKPFWQMTSIAVTHCGSGCTLGDIAAEWLAITTPVVAVAFGWGSLFPSNPHGKLFAVWLIDYLFAFTLGIAFQYFTIKPMRNLSPGKGLVQALKADTLTITTWQVGMYGWIAIATFVIFRHDLDKASPVFWFMMQIGMFCGFLTSWPVNAWLLKAGIKEKM